MNIKFRENAVTAVVRDALGIKIYVRGIEKPAADLRWDQLSAPVQTEGMHYGIEVRLTRMAAIERDTKSGKPASPQEKWDAINRGSVHYASGTEAWAMASGGGGGLSADTRALIEALSTALGLPLDVIEERVRDMTTAERDSLRVDPEIKPALDAVYAERAKSAGVAGMVAKNLIEKLRARS